MLIERLLILVLFVAGGAALAAQNWPLFGGLWLPGLILGGWILYRSRKRR